MRTIFIVFLASAILSGCRNGDTVSVAPLPGRSNVPAAVLRLADAYVGSLTNKQSQDKEEIREHFTRSFFQGFTMRGATMSGGTVADERGFLAGQEYRQVNPTKIKETMEGFGYIDTEADGTWTVSFEHSGFRPQSQPAQTWWLSSFGDTRSDLPKDTKIPDQGVRIHVTGFLSPSGHFGHLGGYDHEFYTITISKIGS